MQRNEKVDILIIVGPDNPGDKTTQQFWQEKLKQRIAYFKDQGLTCKVIGNGKDSVNQTELNNLPKAQCVMVCGHGTVKNQSHQINLSKNTPDTNQLIENIQAQTGAKQFILASCTSGKVNEGFQQGESSIKANSEVIALSPPDDSTSMNFALNSVLHAVNEFGTNKRDNKDTNLGKIYSDLLSASPNAVSYGVQTKNQFSNFAFDPKDLMFFSNQGENFIAENRGNTLANFKQFLKDNKRPALSNSSEEKLSDAKKYEREYLDDFIRRADLVSIAKIVEKSPQLMHNASLNVHQYSHLTDIMRLWANDDRKFMEVQKQLANFDMDHANAYHLKALFKDMKDNNLPEVNKNFIKCALIEAAYETKDNNKKAYLIQSLLYAEGSRLFDGVDQNRAANLRSKLDAGMIEYIKQETLKDACHYTMKRLEQDPKLTLKEIQQALSNNLNNVSWFTNSDMRKEMSNRLYNDPGFLQMQMQNMETKTGKYQLSEYGEFKPNPLTNDKMDNNKNSSASLLAKLSSNKIPMDDQLSGISKAETKRANAIDDDPPKQKQEVTPNNINDSRIQLRNK